MKSAIIIGAGSTRAEACTKRCPRMDLPPLDTDFFQLCNYHKVKDNLDILGKYIKRHYSIELTKQPYPRMEEIFGLVYSDTRMKPPPSGSKQAYIALLGIYKRVILQTTNNLSPTNRGPLAQLIRYTLEKGTCGIITFNQDILIEKVLVGLNRKSSLWFPNDGYMRDFNFTYPSNKKLEMFKTGDKSSSSEIKLMKLHGSLNWYTLTTSKDKIPSTMTNSKQIKCTANMKIPPEFTYVSNAGYRKKWSTWPVIIPPVYEKGGFITDTISPIWNSAQDLIKSADQIIVYGYSFPQADQQSKSFFRRARVNNDGLKRLVVINPDTNAAIVANEIFTPPVLITTKNVKTYVNYT